MVASPAKPEVGEGGLNECQRVGANAVWIKCRELRVSSASLNAGVDMTFAVK